MGTGSGVVVVEKEKLSCSCQGLNPKSSICPSHRTDYAGPY